MIVVKPCSVRGCDQEAFCSSSMCLDHIESGRLFLWNKLRIHEEPVIRDDEYVYALRGKSKLKFGYTTSVEQRFKIHRAQEKEQELTLSGFVHGSRRLETLVLAYVAPDQLHGEWHRDSKRTRFIENLIASGSIVALWNGLREHSQASFV